jgi:hypothetical protein
VRVRAVRHVAAALRDNAATRFRAVVVFADRDGDDFLEVEDVLLEVEDVFLEVEDLASVREATGGLARWGFPFDRCWGFFT